MNTTVLQTLINGVLEELMVKTHGDVVVIDDKGTTLSSKLAEMIAAINLRAKSTDVTTEINTAVTKAVNDLIGSAPDTYNTLQEIAEYIDAHQDVVDTLNAAIGKKVDTTTYNTLKATVDALKTTVEGLGALSAKDKVSESDLDSALATKVNAAAEGKHSHSNLSVLNGITAAKVAAWDNASAGGKVTVSATQPEGMAAGDLWFQIVN